MGTTRVTAQELIRLRHRARGVVLSGKRPVSSVIAGTHLSRFRGRGVDYLESRHYQFGDDIRDLDWKVTARTGHPHTKVFQEERERPVIVLMDVEPGMFFATRGRLKAVVAAELATLIAWAAVRRADRVGALIFRGETHQELRPRGGRRGVMRLVHLIEDELEVSESGAVSAHSSGLAGALQRLRRVARPGSLVILLSDFYGINDDCDRHLSLLRQHTDVAAFQIRDHIESQLPPPALYPISDGRHEGVLDLRNRAVRAEYHAQIVERGRRAAAQVARFGIPVVEVACDDDPVRALGQMFGGRRNAA